MSPPVGKKVSIMHLYRLLMGFDKFVRRPSCIDSAVQAISTEVRRPGQMARRAGLWQHNITANS